MKKFLEAWKLWTVLSTLLFFMTCGIFIVHAAGNSNNWRFYQQYNTGTINNTLTDTWWNYLMEDLDNLIPEGAIMAFLTGECPNGWSPLPQSDWRFLMWTSGQDFWYIGWATNNQISLSVNQLPSHTHLIKFSQVGKFWDEDDARYVPIDYFSDYWPQWGSSSANWGNITQAINIAPSYIKVRYCVKWDFQLPTVPTKTVTINVNDNNRWTVSQASVTKPVGSSIRPQGDHLYIWSTIVRATARDSRTDGMGNCHFDFDFVSWINPSCGDTLTTDCTITAKFKKTVTTCFPAWTKIKMADGTFKNIEKVKAWDTVLSYNTDTNTNESSVVKQTIVHEDNIHEMYELTINGDVLKVTDVHPFYVRKSASSKDYAWIEAQDLKVGDILLMNDGNLVKIQKINHYNNKETVYNLDVENNHNYYVGKWYLVHNKSQNTTCEDIQPGI